MRKVLTKGLILFVASDSPTRMSGVPGYVLNVSAKFSMSNKIVPLCISLQIEVDVLRFYMFPSPAQVLGIRKARNLVRE
jgi:hypothetical protein